MARVVIEAAADRSPPRVVDVRCRLVSSRYPARAILDAAASERADLVLLGAMPRYVGHRAFFGPTVDLVLEHAPCTVAIYVGGVRPEALRAATPEAGDPAAVPHPSSAVADEPGATLHRGTRSAPRRT